MGSNASKPEGKKDSLRISKLDKPMSFNENNSNKTNVEEKNQKEKYLKEFYQKLKNYNLPIGKINQEEKELYDVEILIGSIEDLRDSGDGWKIKLNNEDVINKCKDKKSCIIGVIGNNKTGKTHILQHITNDILPADQEKNTDGICIKYPDPGESNKNITIIDTPGLNLMSSMSATISNEEIIKETKKKKKLIEFTTKFVVNKSHIIICVVNELKTEDLTLINMLKEECKEQVILILHNVYSLTSTDNVKKYMQNYLGKASGKYTPETYTILDDEELKKTGNKTFYVENYKRERDNQEINLIHLIFCNTNNKELVDYFNFSTLNYIRSQIISWASITKFDVTEELKNYIVKEYPEYFGKEIPNDAVEIDKNYIKVNKKEDEQGKGSGNVIIPNYYYYKDTDGEEDKIVIGVEMAGRPEGVKLNSTIISDQTKITLSGKKPTARISADKEPDFSNIPNGNFSLSFKIPLSLGQISQKKKQLSKENGVLKISYVIQ